MGRLTNALKHAWNAFNGHEAEEHRMQTYSAGAVNFGGRPDRIRFAVSNERSIITSIYTRMSIDIAQVEIKHVKLDEQNRYFEDVVSGLQNCLTVEANIDQAARAFRQDIAMTLFDEGVAAIVPVETSINPKLSGGYDIHSLRVGTIKAWMPQHVRVSLYNEAKGLREDIVLPKSIVAIVENPLYPIMNEPNSTLQRLIRKLNLLDAIDEQNASGKLDLIIQLPYVIRNEARAQQAEKRRKDIEFQLKEGRYGIAYTDGTEKITQLNRPVENNLPAQIEQLLEMLYAQLGITKEVMDGTADEQVMLNYHNRTIEPIMVSIVEAMRRTFLTKTARTQRQSIMFFRDPFKIVPLEKIAEMVDKLARNEVASSNELRQVIGWKPRPEAKADKLMNSNMPQPTNPVKPAPSGSESQEEKETVNG